MLERGVNRLPVVDDGRLVGVGRVAGVVAVDSHLTWREDDGGVK
jgi:CBS domain-containing protein